MEAHVDLTKVGKSVQEDVTAISLAEEALFSLRKKDAFYDEASKKTEKEFLELIEYLKQETKKQELEQQQRVSGSVGREDSGDAKSGKEAKESEKDKEKDKGKDKDDDKPRSKPS